MHRDVQLALDLASARRALDRGSLKSAVRHVWDAALVAVFMDDEQSLQETIDLATAVADRASGRMRKDAQMAATYCSRCLADARAGVLPSGTLGRLVDRLPSHAVKTCPECAETVKAEVEVCRFCSHRFDRAL